MFKPKTALNGSQLQHLIDRYNLRVDTDESGEFLSRADGRMLKVETVEKMLGLSNTNWEQAGKSVKVW